MCSAQVHPAAGVNRQLCRKVPIGLNVHPVIHQRIEVLS